MPETTPDTELNDKDYSFVSGGLFNMLLSKIGLGGPGPDGIRKRICFLIAITYVPLLILSSVQGLAFSEEIKLPFLLDVSEAVRFLMVGPLLIGSEVVIELWLVLAVAYIRERLLVADEFEHYSKMIASAKRWRDSYLSEIVLFLCIFPLQWMDTQSGLQPSTTSWRVLPSGNEPSFAWYWFACVAKPMVRFLWLRWLWRYVIWCLLICRISTLRMQIVPTHPDRHGGLTVLSSSHEKFSLLAFAFGLQVASTFAEKILFEGRTLESFKFEIGGVALMMMMIFLTPLLAFTGKLMNAKRKGLFEYSVLADEYTTAFHDKWVVSKERKEPILGSSDIQSLADMGNSYSIVSEMRVSLISKGIVIAFLTATLLPFSPLILTVYPFDVLVNQILKAVM